MNDKVRELVAKAINQNLVVKTNSEGRHFVSLLDPDGDHLFSAPDWGWYEGTVQHRDEMAKRITEIVAAALAASAEGWLIMGNPVAELQEQVEFLKGELAAIETKAGIENVFEQGKAQGRVEGASDLKAKLESLRELSEKATAGP